MFMLAAPTPAEAAERRAPPIAMDASTSIGFGHLVRVICLRDALAIPSEVLGPISARLGDRGIEFTHRGSERRISRDTRVLIVDRNMLGRDAIAWRLADRRRRLIWIRRGLVTPSQAVMQSGFVAFADLVIAPGDLGADGDAVDALADRQGKLRRVGICHAYQRLHLKGVSRRSKVFVSLGAFEEMQRPAYRWIRDALNAAGLDFIWSAYGGLPSDHGFPTRKRVDVSRALYAKAGCIGLVSEGGYNSLHEALHLARPVLFVANDGNGREMQSRRVAAAKRTSPQAFDASVPGDMEAWVDAVRLNISSTRSKRIQSHACLGNGFGEMADVVEEFYAGQAG